MSAPAGRENETARQVRADAEYLGLPGLKLTAAQAARFWHLDTAASARMLDLFVAAGVLHRTEDGAYVLLSADV